MDLGVTDPPRGTVGSAVHCATSGHTDSNCASSRADLRPGGRVFLQGSASGGLPVGDRKSFPTRAAGRHGRERDISDPNWKPSDALLEKNPARPAAIPPGTRAVAVGVPAGRQWTAEHRAAWWVEHRKSIVWNWPSPLCSLDSSQIDKTRKDRVCLTAPRDSVVCRLENPCSFTVFPWLNLRVR